MTSSVNVSSSWFAAAGITEVGIVVGDTAELRRVWVFDRAGATLARARDALLAAGALEVRCAVVAHVRARHPSRVG